MNLFLGKRITSVVVKNAAENERGDTANSHMKHIIKETKSTSEKCTTEENLFIQL